MYSVRWADSFLEPGVGPGPPLRACSGPALFLRVVKFPDAQEALGSVDLVITFCVFSACSGSSLGRPPLFLLSHLLSWPLPRACGVYRTQHSEDLNACRRPWFL